MLAAGPGDDDGPNVNLSQRLAFWLTSVEGDAAAHRAALLTAQLISGLDTRQQARQALTEVLKGLDSCSKQAVRLRLQLAAELLERKLDARAAGAAVPELVQRALQCLSTHCRHDAAATQALATLMAVAARRAATAAALPTRGGGAWLYQELLLPLARSSWRDPEPRRVAAGCAVVAAVLSALEQVVEQPHVALALRAGLAAALEAMWGSATARRVSAAYSPLRQWVAAVGGERLGAHGARRMAAICCRGAADKDAWQVRREALLTLAALLTVVKADERAPSCSEAALGPQPSSGAVEGIPERPGGAALAELGSGAYEALSAQRPRLLAALDSCRHDAIAAVRAAAAEARAAASGLAVRPREGGAEGVGVGGSSPGGGGSSSGGSADRRGGPGLPSRPLLRVALAPSGSALQGFRRPKLSAGELCDFGIQVFAPPSPPRRPPLPCEATAGEQRERPDQQGQPGQEVRRASRPASPAGGSLDSAWPRSGSAQGSAHRQQSDAPLPSPPPVVRIGTTAQPTPSGAKDGYSNSPYMAACAGFAPGSTSPPGSPPYLYHVHADSVLPGSPGVSRIEVAHTVQGRVELVYGASGAGAPALPLLLHGGAGVGGGMPATHASSQPQVAGAASGEPVLPTSAATGDAAGAECALLTRSRASAAPDAVFNEWQHRQALKAPATVQPPCANALVLAPTQPQACASQPGLPCAASDAAAPGIDMKCGVPASDPPSAAAPDSLSHALAAVHQVSSRVGSLLQELSSVGMAHEHSVAAQAAAVEAPLTLLVPAAAAAAAAPLPTQAVTAAAAMAPTPCTAAALAGVERLDRYVCRASQGTAPQQSSCSGSSATVRKVTASGPQSLRISLEGSPGYGSQAAATSSVDLGATGRASAATAAMQAQQQCNAPVELLHDTPLRPLWPQTDGLVGAVGAEPSVSAAASRMQSPVANSDQAAAAVAPLGVRSGSGDLDQAHAANWLQSSEADLLMALSWRLQRLASSSSAIPSVGGAPQRAAVEEGQRAGSERGGGRAGHHGLLRLWASAPGLPPGEAALQARDTQPAPVPASSGGGMAWDIHDELGLLRDELDNHARQPIASLPINAPGGGGASAPDPWGNLHSCSAISNGGLLVGKGLAQLPPAAAIMLGQLLAEEARVQSHSGVAVVMDA